MFYCPLKTHLFDYILRFKMDYMARPNFQDGVYLITQMAIDIKLIKLNMLKNKQNPP